MMRNEMMLRSSRVSEAHTESAGPPGAFLVKHVVACDADEQAANLRKWDQVYEQITPGRFDGRLTEVWLDGLQVFRETTNQSVYENGMSWQGSRTFGIPLAMSASATFHGRAMGLNSLLTLSGGQDLDFRTPLNLDIVGIAVPEQELASFAAQCEEQDIDTLLKAADLVHCLPVQLSAIRRCLSDFFSNLDARVEILKSNPGARKIMREASLARLCALLCAARSDAPRPVSLVLRKQLVDRAKARALEDTCTPVTIADLCRALRVSRRTLQYSFQETLGVSPSAYLRAVRLNGVRRQLKSPDSSATSVQDAAANWGFWHLGHFSSDYKRMFAELPSETLRRRIEA